MTDLTNMAFTKLQALIDEQVGRRVKQEGFITAADREWLEANREHLVCGFYETEPGLRGLGTRKGSPPEISERVCRIVADTVVKMIEAGLQPAYLPKDTADALVRYRIEQAEQANKPLPYHPLGKGEAKPEEFKVFWQDRY